MTTNEEDFTSIVDGRITGMPAAITRKAGIATTVRLAATRNKASEHYTSGLFTGDVLLLSGSAWDDRSGDRIAVPENALVQQIRLAIGDELYSKMLPWLATQADYGIATWHFSILIDDDGAPHHPTPLQVAVMNQRSGS